MLTTAGFNRRMRKTACPVVWKAHGAQSPWAHPIEPNSRLHDYLNKNLGQIGGKLFPEAVGAQAGTGRSSDTGDSRTGVFEKGGDTPIVSFSTVVERLGGTIDLLKIDCEGEEWDIFENPVPFRNVRTIRMEYHLVDGKSLKDLRKAADRIAFEIVKLEENSGFGIAWMESLKS
jgi:FkbM family methyltransferase